jgi:hypothetical protein
MSAGAVIAAVIWFLPSGRGRQLGDFLKEQGYWEIAAPADFYVPGTINTIEVLTGGKMVLHPTCTIPTDLLATMTIKSRGVDGAWKQGLDKTFDGSAEV